MWCCFRTNGNEVVASRKIGELGLEVFCPEIHTYSLDKRTQRERVRVKGLFSGYAFARLATSNSRHTLSASRECHKILGFWSGVEFVPHPIPTAWVDTLRESGPLVIGKRVSYKKGDRVKVVIGSMIEHIATIERVKGESAIISLSMFGSTRSVIVRAQNIRECV